MDFFLPKRLLAILVKNFLAGLGGLSSGTITHALGGSLSGVKPWKISQNVMYFRGVLHYPKMFKITDKIKQMQHGAITNLAEILMSQNLVKSKPITGVLLQNCRD